MNVIVNGVPQGEQSIVGEMADKDARQVTKGQGGGKVIVNGVPVGENGPTNTTNQNVAPTIQTDTQEIINSQTGEEVEAPYVSDESFSIAENYLQWQNLKENLTLDQMFVASTPNAQEHLERLHAYVGSILGLDKKVVDLAKEEKPAKRYFGRNAKKNN